MLRNLASSLALVISATSVFATDRIVDSSGAHGPLLTIDQAMAVSAPGDRILVYPGSYGAFHFSRGVQVIGLGRSPGEVVIARVDFHPTIPTTGFDAALSNLTVCGTGPADGTAISGNELAAGTLVIEGVRACGGVYLHGAGQLYVLVIDSTFNPDPGDGFLGAAFDFAGGALDVVESAVHAAPAFVGVSDAGKGLRLGSASRVRVTRSTILGGSALATGGSFYEVGGAAILQAAGPAPFELQLNGGSIVRGGSTPSATHPSGAGVHLTANIVIGSATVHAGLGAVQGQAFAASQPTQLGFDPSLRALGASVEARRDTFVRRRADAHFEWGMALPPTGLGYATDLTPNVGSIFSPLGTPPAVSMSPSPTYLHLVPEVVVPLPGRVPLQRVYMQGYFTDPETGAVLTTNPVAVTLSP